MQENQVTAQSSLVSNKIIEYHSFIAPTGYTQAAIDNLKAISSVGYDISLRCVHGRMVVTGFNQIEKRWLEKLYNNKSSENAIKMIHAIPPRWRGIKFNNYNISLFVFENKRIPKEWVSDLNRCSCVIVPSEFNKASCLEAGVKNVIKIPHAINFDIWNLDLPSCSPIQSDEDVKIITVGTWRQRKNWESMFESVYELVKQNSNVFWTLKVDKGSQASQDLRSWFAKYQVPEKYYNNFTIDSRVLDESSMARLVKSHSILLSASLGEGFGLPALQASCLGLCVACPKYGGYEEFFDESSHVEIEQSGVERIKKLDNLPQFADLEWPVYKKESICNALYLCISKCRNKEINKNVNYSRFYDNFNYHAIGNKFHNIIKNIHDISSNKS